MKDNKTIGFDILDNAGLDKIDQIGTDTDMLDEKTKKRILEMTRKRFNDAIKGEDKMTFNYNTSENAEIVENVEVYKRSKISKIMTRVINTAAAAGLAVGSVFLVKNINRDNKPVEPDLPAVSTTEDTELTAEEKARNQRIEEYIQKLYNSTGDQCTDEDFYNNLKIDYAYLDINNDSVSELLIRYDFINSAADTTGMSINYFDGTNYVQFYDAWGTVKFDLNNRKLYELSQNYLNESILNISTWENIDFSDNTVFFTSQDNYHPIESEEADYYHNNAPCTKEEYDKAIAEYENCVGAELKFFPYDVKKANEQSAANLSNEETARNQRIEEYIQELYNQYSVADEEQFYNCLEIEYTYLDINNDSVDELFIRYDFLEAAADAKGIGLNYFDGTKYVHFDEIYDASDMAKIDLQNRRLYEIHEGHEPGYYTYVKTWENVEISHESDFFRVQDTYCSNMITYEPEEYGYTHNDLPCTKEEYEKAIVEYENCVGAELDFIPYTIKKNQAAVNGQQAMDLSQEETARNKHINDFIKNLYAYHNELLDKKTFDDTLKIEYAYLDINNDSVDELLIRYDFLKSWDYSGVEFNYFNGTEYVKFDVLYGNTIKFDVPNRKLYEKYDGYEKEFLMEIKTWENVKISSDEPYFTTQNTYHCYMSESNADEIVYTRDGVAYPEAEFKKVQEEYENFVGTELNYISYVPDDSFFIKKNSAQSAANLSQEEIARNIRIEEYIEHLYSCYGTSDEELFYEKLKIDYVYLDINNDSVNELLIRYHNLNALTPYYEGIEINCFDGTKYVPVADTKTTIKFDLQNRKLYELSEEQDGGYWLCIKTWKNSDIFDNEDYFTLTDTYSSNIVSSEPLEYIYTHNEAECSKEEYEKGMSEYGRCDMLNFINYNINQ